MNPSITLAHRFREVILNGVWIANTNFRHQLEGTHLSLVSHQIGSLNTISQLAQHIHYYIKGMNQAFQEGVLSIRDQYSFDFPPMDSDEQWNEFLTLFWQEAEVFALQVEQMSKQQLQAPFIDERYGSFLRNIDAMIEHSYYHLGQIVIIKKMILANRD